MARIVVFNQKGGVGKTTTTLNLAALLARRGRTPLVIDLDPQAHLSAISGAVASDGRDSLYGFYQGGVVGRANGHPNNIGFGDIVLHSGLATIGGCLRHTGFGVSRLLLTACQQQ